MANLVDLLGIPLTRHAPESSEDREFRDPIGKLEITPEQEYGPILEIIKSEITKRNNTNPTWAWKIPQCGRNLHVWTPYLRNPFWIYIVRDHMASAFTEMRIKCVEHAIQGLEIKCEHERFFQKWIERCNQQRQPILLASYERLRMFKGQFLYDLIKFLGTNPPIKNITEAVDYIKDVGPLQGSKKIRESS